MFLAALPRMHCDTNPYLKDIKEVLCTSVLLELSLTRIMPENACLKPWRFTCSSAKLDGPMVENHIRQLPVFLIMIHWSLIVIIIS